jgi:hypothetical protein
MREDGEAEVVPVDDEDSSMQLGHGPGHEESGDAGRVLDQEHVGSCGQLEEEELKELVDEGDDFDGGKDKEALLAG